MQNFNAGIEMLSNIITTEPVTYFLIVKFLTESGFEDNLGIQSYGFRVFS